MGDGEVEKLGMGHDAGAAASGAAAGGVESGQAIAAEAGHNARV
ncbi:DNA polymerase IV [Roseovarius sp. TM1035]|nr:DNA polymerase IV [Roseovarius sp. TM1035]